MNVAELADRLDVTGWTIRRYTDALGLRSIGTNARWAPFTPHECLALDVYASARQMYEQRDVAATLAGAVLNAVTDGDRPRWLTYDAERGIVPRRDQRAVVAAVLERDLTVIDLDALVNRWST